MRRMDFLKRYIVKPLTLLSRLFTLVELMRINPLLPIELQGMKLTGVTDAKLYGAAAVKWKLAICPWVHANDALAQFLRQREQAVSWRDKSLSGMSLPQFPLEGSLETPGTTDGRRGSQDNGHCLTHPLTSATYVFRDPC